MDIVIIVGLIIGGYYLVKSESFKKFFYGTPKQKYSALRVSVLDETDKDHQEIRGADGCTGTRRSSDNRHAGSEAPRDGELRRNAEDSCRLGGIRNAESYVLAMQQDVRESKARNQDQGI